MPICVSGCDPELQLLQSRLGFTSIFVTHDQEEALSLSDRIILMNTGTIEQNATPLEMFSQPATVFAARFLGHSNILQGEITGRQEGGDYVEIELSSGSRFRGRWRSSVDAVKGHPAVATFRGERIKILPVTETSGKDALTGEVEAVSFLGDSYSYIVRMDGSELRVSGTFERAFEPGDEVALSLDPEHCHLFSGTDVPAAA